MARWTPLATFLAAALLAALPAAAQETRSDSLSMEMPSGWTVTKSVRLTGDMVGAAVAGPRKTRPRVLAYTGANAATAAPERWKEWILLRSFPRAAGIPAKELAATLANDLTTGCKAGRMVNFGGAMVGGAVVAGGYHVCSELTGRAVSQLVMFKVVEGKTQDFVVSRHRRAGPIAANEVDALAREVPAKMGNWMKWYSSVRLKLANADSLIGPSTSGSVAKRSSGSGFAIAGARMLTNAHVVKTCKAVRVGGGNAKVLAVDSVADLALLALDKPPAGVARFGTADETRLGMPVMVAGYPFGDQLGNSLTVTTGTINGHGGLKGQPGMFRIDAAVQKGNSGGPVLSQAGNVIGMVRGILDPAKAQNVNFAIEMSVIEAFLAKHGAAVDHAAAGAPLKTPDLAQLATTFTAEVECWK